MVEPGLVGDIPTTGSVRLPPDPRSLEALGRHHTLEAALAELVDNSIDASARHVLIRFVREGDELVRLLIVDDGVGMSGDQINLAMTVGGARDYRTGEIGRFGLGLKAASFSQARSVTVVSQADGAPAVGRIWEVEQAKKDFRCEIVAPDFASAQMEQNWGIPGSTTGTVVRWDGIKNFPHIGNADAVEHFLQSTFASIRSYLGLVFHRLLGDSGIHVLLDIEDAHVGVLLRTEIAPLNPFGYSRTGEAGWPKKLRAAVNKREVDLVCHIWPGRSALEQFKLDGSPLERQGLYVYFNDRLVQRGGWNGLVHTDKQLNLARVAVSVDGDVDGLLRVNPEKSGIDVGPEFVSAVREARARDGSTFEDYLDRARGVFKESNRRRRVRHAMLPAGAGFDPKVRRAFRNEFPEKDDEEVEVRWALLDEGEFFEIDREQRTLWLNSRYRKMLLGGRRGGLNDLPVLKALMFLLTETIFAGQNFGPRDRDNVEAWKAILAAAVKAERS